MSDNSKHSIPDGQWPSVDTHRTLYTAEFGKFNSVVQTEFRSAKVLEIRLSVQKII